MQSLDKLKSLVEEKKIDQAIEFVNSQKDHIEASLFYYNLGSLHAQNGDLVLARINFEKAKSEGMLTPKLLRELEEVKIELGVNYIEESEHFEDFLFNTAQSTPLSFSFIVSCLILVICLFQKSMRKRPSLLKLLLCVALSFAITVGHKFYLDQYNYIVLKEEAFLLEGPSGLFETLERIPAGMRVIIEKSEGNWVRVISPYAYRGWMERSRYEKL